MYRLFLPHQQTATYLFHQSWRGALTLLLLCQLWLAPQPATAAPTPQLEGAVDTPFAITIGESIQMVEPEPGINIFLAGVMSDDRCPTGSACVQAGNARFQLIVSDAKNKNSEILTIGTADDEHVVQYQDYAIELVEVLTPAPKPDENFILLEYKLTLLVTQQPPVEEDEPTPPDAPPAPTGLERILVDACPNFTAYDAGAILQEPINASEPIGNLIFGPLPDAELAENMSGLCGYTNTEPTESDNITQEQTHIATNLEYGHAVVADHLTAEVLSSSSGVLITDWLDLFALATLVSAANPQDQGKTFDQLYDAFNIGDYASLLDTLYEQASVSPSFKVTKLPLAQDDPRDELLWLWQTLEEGYFSLLISRQGAEFDVVAARLGSHLTEKTVLGYSRVILEKLADDITINSGSDSTPSAGCDLLSPDAVATILGEPAQGQAVVNTQGEGCKYTPEADEQTIDRGDFSQHFATHGLLAGIVPPKSAERLLSGMIEELSTNGNVTDGDALEAIIAALNAGDFSATLTQMGELAWESNRWQVEILNEVSDDALLLYGKSGSGWPQFFLLYSRKEGGVYYLTGVLSQEIDEVREALIAAATQLAEAQPSPSPSTPTREEPAALSDCEAWALAEVEALLGEPAQTRAVSSNRGAGCKYTPRGEDPIAGDDFSPDFASRGILAGVMPLDAAQWLLGDLIDTLSADEESTAALQADLENGDINAVLHQLAALKLTTPEWQAEGLPATDDKVIWIHSEEEGKLLSFFFQGLADGRLLVVASQLSADQEIDSLHSAAVTLLQKLREKQ